MFVFFSPEKYVVMNFVLRGYIFYSSYPDVHLNHLYLFSY